MVRYARRSSRYSGRRNYRKYSKRDLSYTPGRLSRGRPLGRNRMLRKKWMRKGASKLDSFVSGQAWYVETVRVDTTTNITYNSVVEVGGSMADTIATFKQATNTKLDPNSIVGGKMHGTIIKGHEADGSGNITQDLITEKLTAMLREGQTIPKIKGIKISVISSSQNTPCCISFMKRAGTNWVFKQKAGKVSVFLKRYKTHENNGAIFYRVACGAFGPCNVRVRYYVKFGSQQVNSYVPGERMVA